MTKLDGKTAVITGGASGIGLATAKRFIDEGAFVYIFGRRQEALDAALPGLGSNARAVRGDTTKLEDLDRLIEAVKAERGSIDIVFANAGVGDFAQLGEITPEHVDWTFDINVKGTLFTVQKALPLMKPGGSIILTGSTTGSMGTAAMSVYSASKAAIRNLARSWALDLKGTGIRVNVLSPGATETEKVLSMFESTGMGDQIVTGFQEGIPLGRMGEAAEIASVAAFLASGDSSFMTGSEVFADGGHAQV
ncbi:SDR family NAD(P)-dependent oxidoreductase [Rhodobium gokarnense]|uniref:NAD(P)-dependent dehydrogenase (Short-subunit alcohol dehydrogenase family) n=1 Tax=Rhodobium gokarnense TaxID=364296 RepID=A0ABT3HB47_9HYPH|nr:SDR family oxidoreductase [Rhodobium gokarnense]MCW2307559.1 NAD(P)-dependent dehydrogenase (short-subunit alcohol dehydrogenase family) [Rhodobium gokarnense]